MPERPPNDELEMNQPVGPVWAPNPGVPILARVLAYTFGGLMLITFLATCFTRTKPDIPRFPNAWATDKLSGCILSYPSDWHLIDVIQEDEQLRAHQVVALMKHPSYPVRFEVILQEVEAPDSISTGSLMHAINAAVESNLSSREYTDFQVQQDGGPYTDSGASFTFKDDRESMAGEWTIITKDKYALVLIGFATKEGWQATQIIMREMVARVQWAK